MNKGILTAQCNITTRQWNFDEHAIAGSSFTINFEFVSLDEAVVFNNLSFGVIVTKAGKVVYHRAFPLSGFKYISTDQQVLQSINVPVEPDVNHELLFWVDDSGLRTEESYLINVPSIEPYPDYEVQ